MLNEFLRILLRRVLFALGMKGLDKARDEIAEKNKEEIPDFKVIKKGLTVEERVARVREYMDSFDKFTTRPMMAETYEANMYFAFKIFRVVAVVFTVAVVVIIVYSNVKFGADLNTDLCMGLSALTVWLIAFLIKFCQKYMEKTKCIYYNNRIVIKRYLRKDKEITYDELKECISKRKIKVHNGRFELPYKGGIIPVYTWGDDPVSAKFYQFINEKCDIQIPEITQAERDVVRKTGIGWILSSFFGIPAICAGVAFGFIGTVSEFGINFGYEFWKYYISYLLSWLNIFGLMGLFFIIIGIILKIIFSFPAIKHFKAHKDLIKVSLF